MRGMESNGTCVPSGERRFSSLQQTLLLAQQSWEGRSFQAPSSWAVSCLPESGNKCTTSGWSPPQGVRRSGCPGTYPQPEGGCLSGSKGNKRRNTSAIGSRKKQNRSAESSVLSIIRPFSTSAAEARGFFNALQSICIRKPLFYGILGCQEDLSGFLKTLINHFHHRIKVFWGEKGKESFAK